jgi:MerR family transcriptional regulator, copper efflux regulator
LHQIGEVSDLIGLSLRTIRHYEEVGVVVPSERTSGGFRLYSDRDIERLRKVMGMKPMGFTLEEIHEVLDLLDATEAPDAPDAVWVRLEMYSALAAERREKYERKLALASDFTAQLQAICLGRQQAR